MRVALIAGGSKKEQRWIEESVVDVGNVIRAAGSQVVAVTPEEVSSIDADLAYALDTTSRRSSPQIPIDVRRCLARRGIPLIGPGLTTFLVARDKRVSRHILSTGGIRIPPGFPARSWRSRASRRAVDFPVITKPAFGSGGRGVAVAASLEELEDIEANAKEPLIVEQLLSGREFTVAVVMDSQGLATSLEPAEIGLTTSVVFDYSAKVDLDAHTLHIPGRLDSTERAECKRVAGECAELIGTPPFVRVDMLLVGKEFVVLEVNAEPLLSKNDLVARSALVSGVSYEELIMAPIYRAQETS